MKKSHLLNKIFSSGIDMYFQYDWNYKQVRLATMLLWPRDVSLVYALQTELPFPVISCYLKYRNFECGKKPFPSNHKIKYFLIPICLSFFLSVSLFVTLSVPIKYNLFLYPFLSIPFSPCKKVSHMPI